MRLKARVAKLDAAAFESWNATWEAYMNAALDLLPQGAIECLAALVELPPEQDMSDEASYQEASQALGLDGQAWLTWHARASEQEPLYFGGRVDYRLTPSKLPLPPHCPDLELERVQAWDYPDTPEGNARTLLAFQLARAVVICRDKKG